MLLSSLYKNAISSAEKVFKTDIHYVIKGGLWLSIGQFFALLSGLALSVVFANVLPKEVYGNYKFILTLAGVLSGLSLTGMGTVIVQAVARGSEGVLFDAIRTHLRFGLLVVTASLITASYYFFNGNNVVAVGIIIAGLSLPIIGAYGLYGSFLTGRKDFKSSTILWTIGQSINVMAMILCTLLTHNVILLVGAYFFSQAITTYSLHKYAIKRWYPNSIKDDSIVNYGKHISVMNLFGTVANQLDKILVFHYLGAVELAVYTFAFALPEQIKGSFKNLFSIALPKYAKLDHIELRASIIDKIIRLTLATAIIVSIYIAFSPLVFNILFPRYLDSVFYSQIYSLGLIAIPGISLFSTYFQLRQKVHTLYKLNLVSNITTIVLTFILISQYGLLGAVVENGLSWLVMLAINGYYFATDKITSSSLEDTTPHEKNLGSVV